MSYKVSANDISKIRLNETDRVESILQNIAIILATRQGTVPLYRNFGLQQKFLDRPISVAKTLLCAEVKEAVEQFEPRASVVGISFQGENSDAPGQLIPVVEVKIIDA